MPNEVPQPFLKPNWLLHVFKSTSGITTASNSLEYMELSYIVNVLHVLIKA